MCTDKTYFKCIEVGIGVGRDEHDMMAGQMDQDLFIPDVPQWPAPSHILYS